MRNPTTPIPISSETRSRVVRRLTALVGVSIAAQAAVFLALSWAYRFAAQSLLEAAARANVGPPSAAADAIALTIVVALDLFIALAIGYFAARRLLRSIVRATPHPMKPPTQPVAWAALIAAGVIVTFSVFFFASKNEPLGMPWFGWAFELFRDGAIVALFWIAAVRAAGPQVR